jgi:glycosyltransferase involved in cell wall biosynthesis
MSNHGREAGEQPTMTLLIPTLNKEKNLPRILPKIPTIVTEVLIVDGHSQDATVKVAKEICPQARITYQGRKILWMKKPTRHFP